MHVMVQYLDLITCWYPQIGSSQFDPFATGGGWFYWPGTDDPLTGYPGDRTNFGYSMNYNQKNLRNVKGSLLLIRHLADGSKYRVKSNALEGLSLGDAGLFGWASFSGKATYLEPGMLEPIGNHTFLAYVEDHDEPGNGMHFHQHLAKRGRNLFFKKGGYGNLSKLALSYVGGLLMHGRALLALTCASTNSYRRLVPGFEAPTCFVFAIGNRSAAVRIPKGISTSREARIEFRPSDSSGNSYLGVAAMLMAGIDGIKRRIDPTKQGFGPYDLDVFGIADLAGKGITPVPLSLEEALESLRCDNEFLLEGGVFTEDLIETWIELKRDEARVVGRHPHPYEIELYLDC